MSGFAKKDGSSQEVLKSGVDMNFEDFGINLDSLYTKKDDGIKGGATRTYEQLTPEDKSKVDNMVEGLKEHLDPASISSFASSEVGSIANFSAGIFEKCKIGDMKGFREAMMTFRQQLQSVDTKELMPKDSQNSILAKIPVIGNRIQEKWDKKAEEYFQRTQTVGKFVDQTVVELGKVQVSVVKDQETASSLKRQVFEYSAQLELRIIAAERVMDSLQQIASQMKERADTNNIEEMYRIADVEHAITLLDRKIYDLRSFRVISLNDIQKLSFIENADQAVSDKISDIKTNVVPQWKSQFAIAYYAYRLHGATAVIDAVNRATKDILLTGSKMTHEAIVSSVRAIEAPAISIDTMRAVNEQLKATIEEVIRIEDDAKEMRKQATSQMKQFEGDITKLNARFPVSS